MLLYYYFVLFSLCYSSELFEDYYIEAEEYMKKMTIEEKIGQMFFASYIAAKAKDDIKNKKPGGFVLFGNDFSGNDSYIQKYITELQDLAKEHIALPLGLAVDEEGGTVCRVSTKHREGGKFPSPQQIYSSSGIEGILKIDQEKRNLLRKYYLNINLAPVADNSYNKNDYIHERSLGRSPKETADYIAADVEGYVKDNFTCCAKHFPGYGNNTDTHQGIAFDNRTYEIFQNEDFKAFQAGIDKNLPMILVSHNIVRCKDHKYPASLSKLWHDILRKELKFSGLIITDDLKMGAIEQYADNENVAVLAVKAGNDILLTGKFDEHYKAVVDAVKNGFIPENKINTACRRIIAWKLKYLIGFNPKKEDNNTNNDNKNTALIVIFSLLAGLIVIGIILFLIIKYKKKKDLNAYTSYPEQELMSNSKVLM